MNEVTRPDCSAAAAPVTERKPAPWSILAEPSPRNAGLAPRRSALRISAAAAAGNALRKSAAAPAAVGDENDVPDTHANPAWAVPAMQAASNLGGVAPLLQLPWAKVANPLAVMLGFIVPSASGPRELKYAVCVLLSGRNSAPMPGPY